MINRRLLLQLLILSFIASASFAVASPHQPQNLRVTWSVDPATVATVSWDTVKIGESTLYYDTVSRKGNTKKYANKITQIDQDQYYQSGQTLTPPPAKQKGKRKAAQPTEAPTPIVMPEYCFNHAKLNALLPGTTYYLLAETNGARSEEFHFKTAPEADKDIKLFYGGDSRTDLPAATAISELISEVFEDQPELLGLIHGGDYASKPRLDQWKDWLGIYSLTTTDDNRLLPIIPLRGNHEGTDEPLFDQAYDSPGKAIDNFFTMKFGPQISIIFLNSEAPADGTQKEFLENTLKQMKKDKVRWQIASYHVPVYPSVKGRDEAAFEHWVPLFEKYNIDLALEADGHNIKRTFPIRADAPADDGIVYLGEGGMGAPQRAPDPERWYLQEPGYISHGHHIMTLDFYKDRIEYETIILGGETIDSAIFKARKR